MSTTYEIQGQTFTLKPNSYNNVQPVTEYLEEIQKIGNDALARLDEAMEAGDEDRIEEIAQEFEDIDMPDAWEQRFTLFPMLVDGPVDEVSLFEIPADTYDEILEDFLPSWVQTSGDAKRS